MALEQASCFYHSDREAVAKCENCSRMICLEDKMTHRRYGGIDQADDIYTYCPICYNETKKSAKKLAPFMILLFVVFAIVAIGIFILFGLFIMDMINNFSSA
ncbi:MAG: hypothetical protein ACXAC2_12620 [Candidatus Kariarchaeaceae archaeon]|jgi:hypothetical protein